MAFDLLYRVRGYDLLIDHDFGTPNPETNGSCGFLIGVGLIIYNSIGFENILFSKHPRAFSVGFRPPLSREGV